MVQIIIMMEAYFIFPFFCTIARLLSHSSTKKCSVFALYLSPYQIYLESSVSAGPAVYLVSSDHFLVTAAAVSITVIGEGMGPEWESGSILYSKDS